jgi:hypothetical protein
MLEKSEGAIKNGQSRDVVRRRRRQTRYGNILSSIKQNVQVKIS